ncbi:pyridoxamine 5'-phosphate oxidase family protein, partial [Phocaeicola vulgatus]
VPLSYVYDGAKLYFHCAQTGHKLDAIRRNAKASFCVVDQDQIVPEEYTTYFRSVIVFGQMRVLTDEEEKRAAIEKLAVKYAPADTEAGRRMAIERDWKPLC